MESAKENATTTPDVNTAGMSGGTQTTSGDVGATASQNMNQQQAAQPPAPQQQQQMYAAHAAAGTMAKANARGGAAAGDGGARKGKGAAGAKKNAKANDATGIGMPKKPSPRARTPKASKAATDGGDAGAGKKKMTAAEKKRAAAAAAVAVQNTAESTQPANEKRDNPTAMGPTAPGNGGQMNATNSSSELLPVHDNELRKSYLQQVYRQLLATHRNQDDNTIRQVATNVEMEVCKKATSRSEYIATLNHEINKLMQKELANGGPAAGNVAFSNANAQAPGVNFGGYRNSESASTPAPGTAPGKNSTPQARPSGYAGSQNQDYMRGQAHTQGQGVPPTQSSEGSFMQSLLSDQNPASTYAQSKGHLQTGTPVYTSMGVTSQHGGQPSANRGYAQNAQGRPQTPTNIHMHQAYQQQQQRQSRPLSPGTTLAEFAAQVQHFDKNALIELLWNQRNSLIQWQRRAAQLEAAFNARYNSGSPAVSSSYYNTTPTGMQSYGSSVSPAVSAEAELQRANGRRNGRMAHQQHQYPGQQSPYAGGGNTGSPMSATGGGMGTPVSPMMYWEKVRNLKSAYSQDLYLAHRALSQHNAPPNSTQSIKAETVKHNITLAMNVLNEPPKNIQPRPFEVLTSIERFIQSTIIPIVQKVGPGMSYQQSDNPGAGPPPNYPTSAQNPSTSTGYSYTAGMGVPSMPGNGKFNQGNVMQQGNSAPAQVAAQDSNPSAAGSSGMKTKSEQVGSQRMPPQSNARAKPGNAEGKSTAKKGSKAKEAKPAAAPPSSHRSISDGHQSPFGAGLSAMDKMSTPTVSPSDNRMMAPAEDSVKSIASDAANKSMTDNADDDALNDFSDFPELDFDEEMPSMKVQFNKENNSYNTKKRSVEDV